MLNTDDVRKTTARSHRYCLCEVGFVIQIIYCDSLNLTYCELRLQWPTERYLLFSCLQACVTDVVEPSTKSKYLRLRTPKPLPPTQETLSGGVIAGEESILGFYVAEY